MCDFDTTLNDLAMSMRAITDLIVAATTAAMIGNFGATIGNFAMRKSTIAALMGAFPIADTIGDFDTTLNGLDDFDTQNSTIAALISSSLTNRATDSRGLTDALHHPHELRRIK